MAHEALIRIADGAYANLVLPHLLARSDLSPADRRFATDLVYGTARMQRACDWLVDRFLARGPEPATRAALRLGAYQLEFLRTPPHAAVSATVAIAPARTRGLVNAVLRRVADAGHPDAPGSVQPWPSDAVRLSYPDWMVERLCTDLGPADGLAALVAMDEPPPVTTRQDGYVQDLASQWVAAAVGPHAGDRIADLCAGPGGKATAMAAAADTPAAAMPAADTPAADTPAAAMPAAALVAALDLHPARARMVAENAARLGARTVAALVADGTAPPLRPGSLERVLVDAPCSGLGVLRRRPDARWRIGPDDVADLAALQRRLLAAGAALLRPGGVLAYSVCTMTAAETTEVDDWLAVAHPDLAPLPPPDAPWIPVGRGARLLPQTAGTDGMFLLLVRRDPSLDSAA